MTQIQTERIPSIGQGPRGIGARSSGGAYSQDCQSDLIDADAFQGGLNILTGTTDAIIIPPQFNYPYTYNFIISTGSADAITLTLPRVGLDDNFAIAIYSDTAFAHTVTLPSAAFSTGAGQHSVATFPAFRGAGLTLRAFNGTWQVISSTGTVVFSA
jgi:hypothetical protein